MLENRRGRGRASNLSKTQNSAQTCTKWSLLSQTTIYLTDTILAWLSKSTCAFLQVNMRLRNPVWIVIWDREISNEVSLKEEPLSSETEFPTQFTYSWCVPSSETEILGSNVVWNRRYCLLTQIFSLNTIAWNRGRTVVWDREFAWGDPERREGVIWDRIVSSTSVVWSRRHCLLTQIFSITIVAWNRYYCRLRQKSTR